MSMAATLKHLRPAVLDRPLLDLRTWTPGRRTAAHAAVPADTGSPVWFGILVHLGAVFASVAILPFIGVSFVHVAVVAAVGSAITMVLALGAAARMPSAELPALERRQLWVHFCWDIVGKGLVIGGVVLSVGWLGLDALLPWELGTTRWTAMLAAVLACDFWYYAVHRWGMHSRGARWLTRLARREHNIHHRVTALDFFRGNQGSLVDNGVVSFPLPLLICTAVLGLSPGAVLWVYWVLMVVQVTHHTNHTFDIGPLRWVVFDSHAHKMHHCRGGQLVNYAAVFAIWDRLFGSYYEDPTLSPTHMHTHGIALPIKAARRRR